MPMAVVVWAVLPVATRAASNPRCLPGHAFQVTMSATLNLHGRFAVRCKSFGPGTGLLACPTGTLRLRVKPQRLPNAASTTHNQFWQHLCCCGINIKAATIPATPRVQGLGVQTTQSQRSIHTSKIHKAKHPVCAQNPAANRRAEH